MTSAVPRFAQPIAAVEQDEAAYDSRLPPPPLDSGPPPIPERGSFSPPPPPPDSERASAFDTPFDSSRYEPPGTRTGLPDIATVDIEWI